MALWDEDWGWELGTPTQQIHTTPAHAHWTSRGFQPNSQMQQRKDNCLANAAQCPPGPESGPQTWRWNSPQKPFLLQLLCLRVEETETQSEESLAMSHRVSWKQRQHQNPGFPDKVFTKQPPPSPTCPPPLLRLPSRGAEQPRTDRQKASSPPSPSIPRPACSWGKERVSN